MRVVTLDTNKEVMSVKNVGDAYVLGVNDIVTELGEVGQIQQPDGTFITPEPVPVVPTPTIEERLTGIEDTQDLILLKLEGVIT